VGTPPHVIAAGRLKRVTGLGILARPGCEPTAKENRGPTELANPRSLLVPMSSPFYRPTGLLSMKQAPHASDRQYITGASFTALKRIQEPLVLMETNDLRMTEGRPTETSPQVTENRKRLPALSLRIAGRAGDDSSRLTEGPLIAGYWPCAFFMWRLRVAEPTLPLPDSNLLRSAKRKCPAFRARHLEIGRTIQSPISLLLVSRKCRMR